MTTWAGNVGTSGFPYAIWAVGKKLRVVTLYGRFVAFKFSANEIDKVTLRPICHAMHSFEVLYFSLFFLHGDISWTAPFVFHAPDPTAAATGCTTRANS